MLARTSSIHHPSGLVIKTPLLVPSFSSKGLKVSKAGKSAELIELIEWSKEFLVEACLLSAFDMHYGLCHPPEKIPLNLDLTIIDSGGYEISESQDLSTVYSAPPKAKKWDRDKLKGTLERWPADRNAIFVSYDNPNERFPFNVQVEHAANFSAAFPHQLHTLLLKPESKNQDTVRETIKHAVADVDSLARFDVIGVTEKELGKSLFERMVSIATLRLAMDRGRISTPIHVFGALDPISVPHFFIAGAEIFDGLTWLRYGYYKGICIYRNNCSALKFDIKISDYILKSHLLSHNINDLTQLAGNLRVFAHKKDFGRFGEFAEVIHRASEELEAHLS